MSFSITISMFLSLLSLMYGMTRRATFYATRKEHNDDDNAVVKSEDALEMPPYNHERVGGDNFSMKRRKNSHDSDDITSCGRHPVDAHEGEFYHRESPPRNGSGAHESSDIHAPFGFGRISRVDTDMSMSNGPIFSPRSRRNTSLQASRGKSPRGDDLAIDLDTQTAAVVPRVRKYSDSHSRSRSRSRSRPRTSSTHGMLRRNLRVLEKYWLGYELVW